MTTTPSAVIRWSRCARRRVLTASGSDDATMSKRRCSAVDTLFTFWPPAPCARMADHSISAGGMRIIAAGRVRLRGQHPGELAAADQALEIGCAADQHALDEDHREGRPA